MTGVILAGGDNKRMQGRTKALMPFGGGKLIVRQLQLMKPACSELIVVTNEPKPYLRLLDSEIRIITDFVSECGPLGGMYAGLSLARHRDVWVVGSHMPFVSAQAAKLLQIKKQSGFEAVFPRVRGVVYPLHGVYDCRCAERIWPLLRRGDRSLLMLLTDLHWGEVKEAEFREADIGTDFVDCFSTVSEYEQLLRKHSLASLSKEFKTVEQVSSRSGHKANAFTARFRL